MSLQTKIVIAGGAIKLSGLNVDLHDLEVTRKTKGNGAIGVKSIAPLNASANTGARQFQADALHIKCLAGDIKRDAQGKLNVQQFMLPTGAAKPQIT